MNLIGPVVLLLVLSAACAQLQPRGNYNVSCDDPNSYPNCVVINCQTCLQQLRQRRDPYPQCEEVKCVPGESCRCAKGYYIDDITPTGKCITWQKCQNKAPPTY